MKKVILFVFMLVGFTAAANAQTSPAPKDSTVNQILGKYKFADGSPVAEVTVALENGVLVMNSAAGSSTLEKTGEDTYVITQFQGTAKFTRNDSKVVTGVTILAMGYELVGTKEINAVPLYAIRKAAKPVLFVK